MNTQEKPYLLLLILTLSLIGGLILENFYGRIVELETQIILIKVGL